MCPKSALRGCKLSFFRGKESLGHLQQKVGESQECMGMEGGGGFKQIDFFLSEKSCLRKKS